MKIPETARATTVRQATKEWFFYFPYALAAVVTYCGLFVLIRLWVVVMVTRSRNRYIEAGRGSWKFAVMDFRDTGYDWIMYSSDGPPGG